LTKRKSLRKGRLKRRGGGRVVKLKEGNRTPAAAVETGGFKTRGCGGGKERDRRWARKHTSNGIALSAHKGGVLRSRKVAPRLYYICDEGRSLWTPGQGGE